MTTSTDRRALLRGMLWGVAAVAGLALVPAATEAMPLGELAARKPDDLIQKAQVVVVGHPRRRRPRRWVCWWHRGRRVCGWR